MLSLLAGYMNSKKNILIYYIKGSFSAEEYSRRLIKLIHICYTSIILSCILKEKFQKPTGWIFRFFSYSCPGGLIHINLN